MQFEKGEEEGFRKITCHTLLIAFCTDHGYLPENPQEFSHSAATKSDSDKRGTTVLRRQSHNSSIRMDHLKNIAITVEDDKLDVNEHATDEIIKSMCTCDQ